MNIKREREGRGGGRQVYRLRGALSADASRKDASALAGARVNKS